MSALVEVRGVSYRYAVDDAVAEVSLTLSAGELLAIVGPNGCGKSTLLKLLCGAIMPTRGDVLVNGTNLRAVKPVERAKLIALVPQVGAGAVTAFSYSVRQMVLMGRYHVHARAGAFAGLGFETADDHRIAYEAMWAADVHHLADRAFTSLSGGERQRVLIARALAQHAPVLLLDEPTSALDLYHQLEVLEHVRATTREVDRAVAMVTHDLNLAHAAATRVVLMDGGRVVADGKPAEILTPRYLEPVYRVKVGRGELLRFERA